MENTQLKRSSGKISYNIKIPDSIRKNVEEMSLEILIK